MFYTVISTALAIALIYIVLKLFLGIEVLRLGHNTPRWVYKLAYRSDPLHQGIYSVMDTHGEAVLDMASLLRYYYARVNPEANKYPRWYGVHTIDGYGFAKRAIRMLYEGLLYPDHNVWIKFLTDSDIAEDSPLVLIIPVTGSYIHVAGRTNSGKISVLSGGVIYPKLQGYIDLKLATHSLPDDEFHLIYTDMDDDATAITNNSTCLPRSTVVHQPKMINLPSKDIDRVLPALLGKANKDIIKEYVDL